MQNDAAKREHRVGERMLAKEAAFGDVHDKSEQPCGGEADFAGLLDAPVEDDQRHEIGLDRELPARPWQQIGQQRRDKSKDDEPGFHRQQDFVQV